MKKIIALGIAILVLVALTPKLFAQTPTVTIDNVVTGEQNGVKGDFVTITVHSEAASGYSCGFDVDWGKEGKGGSGGFGYPVSDAMFGHKTSVTVTRFCGLLNSWIHKDRTWTVRYSYIPDDDSQDPYPWTVEATYFVSGH